MRNKQIVNNKGQIVDQQAFNKALFTLMEERFKGGMETQSKSFKGVMARISGTFGLALSKIAGISETGEIKVGGLFDVIKNKALLLAGALEKMAENGTLEKWGQKTIDILNSFGNTIKWVKDNANWLIPVLTGVVGAITAFKVITTIKNLMMSWKAVTQGMTIAQWALNVALNANPIGLVAIGIGALIAAGVALWKNWDTVKAKAQDLWKGISNFFKSGINMVIGLLNKLIDKANVALKLVGKEIPKLQELQLEPALPDVNAMRALKGDKPIPEYALGTHYFSGGLAKINERGGEIVNLPSGSKVIPSDKTDKIINNTTNSKPIINININAVKMSADEIANTLMLKLKLAIENNWG